MRRTQIYLEDGQHARLAELAERRGTTASRLIRDAIDAFLDAPGDEEAWRAEWVAAVEATAGIAPYIGEEFERGRAADRERQRLLDERWVRTDDDPDDPDGPGGDLDEDVAGAPRRAPGTVVDVGAATP